MPENEIAYVVMEGAGFIVIPEGGASLPYFCGYIYTHGIIRQNQTDYQKPYSHSTMTEQEFNAKSAQNNAEYRKEVLRIQREITCWNDRRSQLTKNYIKEKEEIDAKIKECKLALAEAGARAADTKAALNRQYLESLKSE